MAYDGTKFGLWLREHRRARDMTQQELAGQIGCSDSTLRKFEAGTRRPSKQIVERLLQFFSISHNEQPAVIEWARLGITELQTRHHPRRSAIRNPEQLALTSHPLDWP